MTEDLFPYPNWGIFLCIRLIHYYHKPLQTVLLGFRIYARARPGVVNNIIYFLFHATFANPVRKCSDFFLEFSHIIVPFCFCSYYFSFRNLYYWFFISMSGNCLAYARIVSLTAWKITKTYIINYLGLIR